MTRSTVSRVALATASEIPDLDDEGQLLARTLLMQGVDVSAEVWDDASVTWSDYDLVVVRSTWDYPVRHKHFLEWAESVAEQTQIANPTSMLVWTTDKRYLDDLRQAGVPTVRSVFLEEGDETEHELLDVEHVVKPTISAGSKDTVRVSPGQRERSIAHIRSILDSGRTALVQPYLHAVDENGETALIYIDGHFSHAIRKASILERDADLVEGLFAHEQIESRDPTDRELAVGDHALSVIPDQVPPLYARVDLLPGDDQEPEVLELELAEPSLFLEHHRAAATTLADAIRRRLGPQS